MTGEDLATPTAIVTYLRLYTDDDRESHFDLGPVGHASDPEAPGRVLLDEGRATGYTA